MSICASCEATLESADRFCPACGTPNSAGKLHPRFGPALRELPMIVEVGGDGTGCPRCDAPVLGHDPFCRYCGMALEGYHSQEHRPEGHGSRSVGGSAALTRYRPLQTLCRCLMGVLVVDVVIALAMTVVLLMSVAADPGTGGSAIIGGAHGGLIWPLRLACGAGVGITAVLFLVWFTRAYANLEVLAVQGVNRRPVMALVSWFIPLANLVLPKEMVDDLWRASDPSTPVNSIRWRLRSVPYRIHIWWLASLLMAVSLVAVQWMLPGADGVPTSVGNLSVVVVVLAYPLLAVSSVLLAMLVGDVSERQVRRVEVLSSPSPLRVIDGEAGAEQEAELEAWTARASQENPARVGVSGRY